MEQSRTASFKVDQLWDDRHSAIIILHPVKAETPIKAGQILKFGADGLTVEPATEADTLAGVALDDIKAGSGAKSVNVLVHGTIRTERVTVGDDAITAAGVAKLRACGVYAID